MYVFPNDTNKRAASHPPSIGYIIHTSRSSWGTSFSAALSYDRRTLTTTGLVTGLQPKLIELIGCQLPELFFCIGLPMLVPVILAEAKAEEVSLRIDKCHHQVENIEGSTGMTRDLVWQEAGNHVPGEQRALNGLSHTSHELTNISRKLTSIMAVVAISNTSAGCEPLCLTSSTQSTRSVWNMPLESIGIVLQRRKSF